jgi:hypothetical protein
MVPDRRRRACPFVSASSARVIRVGADRADGFADWAAWTSKSILIELPAGFGRV